MCYTFKCSYCLQAFYWTIVPLKKFIIEQGIYEINQVALFKSPGQRPSMLAFDICRLLTFHILIFFHKTFDPDESTLAGMILKKGSFRFLQMKLTLHGEELLEGLKWGGEGN